MDSDDRGAAGFWRRFVGPGGGTIGGGKTVQLRSHSLSPPNASCWGLADIYPPALPRKPATVPRSIDQGFWVQALLLGRARGGALAISFFGWDAAQRIRPKKQRKSGKMVPKSLKMRGKGIPDEPKRAKCTRGGPGHDFSWLL